MTPPIASHVLVPIEPTKEMIEAYNQVPCGIGGSPPHGHWVWSAMVRAAPVVAPAEPVGQVIEMTDRIDVLWWNKPPAGTQLFASPVSQGIEQPALAQEVREPKLPEPDTTRYAQWHDEKIKYHSVDQILEFANARVRFALAQRVAPISDDRIRQVWNQTQDPVATVRAFLPAGVALGDTSALVKRADDLGMDLS